MIGPFSAEAVWAGGYAVGLLAAAAGLDHLAAHVHVRSDRHRTAGFTYRPEHDSWVCPTDQVLWPQRVDHEHRVVRYRAKPSVCNSCPLKARCTTSSDGREVVRAIDPWPHSEAGRFHRGICLVLVVLAGTFVLVGGVLHQHPADLVLTGVLSLAVGLAGWWLTGHFRATPANFPDTGTSPSPQPIPDAYRTAWGSDTRRTS